MRNFILIASCLFSSAILICGCNHKPLKEPAEKVTINNDKIKVTEYFGDPMKDVCGIGMHSHGPHLTILLTDADVELTTPDGKKKINHLLKGVSFWSEGGSHIAVNIGKNPVRTLFVEPKQAAIR